MAVCAGIKRSGGRCTVSVPAGHSYCHHHDPARAEERRHAASRAGKSKPSRELTSLKVLLQDLTRDVLSGELETGRAAVANQLINTRLRAIELERKVHEQEERAPRLEAVERILGGRPKAL